MKNKANNKSVSDKTNASANDAVNENHPSAGEDPASVDMNADEMAMFNQIMGEIEGQAKSESSNSSPQGALPLADADDDLDEEQQKALESIMAQIEGDKSDGTGASESQGDDTAQTKDEEDDFAAELEKVAGEADAMTPDTPAPPKADADDDLDEDQQKAFESIMAQIEGGNDKSDGTDASGSQDDDTAQTKDEEDDFTAELEEVSREADAMTPDTPATQKAAADDDLDEEQQKAIASIMAEIEGQGSNDATTEPVETRSNETQPKQKAGSEQESVSISDGTNEDEDSNDISDDIEDILKEITSDIEEPDDSLIEVKTDPDEPETCTSNDHIADEGKSGNSVLEKSDSENVAEEEKKARPTPAINNAKKGGSESEPANNPRNTKAKRSPQKTSPLPKVSKSSGVGKKIGIAVSIFSIISLALSGYFYWYHNRLRDPAPFIPVVVEPVQPVHAPAVIDDVPQPAPVNDDFSDQARLKAIAEQLDQLRDQLLAKRKEIEELRDYYQNGIDTEIRSIVEKLQNLDSGRVTLKTATLDPLIDLGMKAIQRRDAYINKLKNPMEALYFNSEELLYLSRKAGLLTMMAEKTSDIDVDGFLKQAQVIMTAHRNALGQLNIDDVEVPVQSIDAIWQRIDSQLSMKPKKSKVASSAVQTGNEAIWTEICRGNYSQKHKLTELSPEAAHCLASWKGKDLFLNELTDLSPATARQLSIWDGEWLGLNGIRELSPETATYLARWKGRKLSLNGLSRLSPRVVAILSEWQGDQIELINLKYMAHWENPKTRLFLPEEIGQKKSKKGNKP